MLATTTLLFASLVRVTGDSFRSVGVGVRGTPGVSSIFGAISGADSTFPAPNSLVIQKSGVVLQQVPTTLDPTKMDVWIQLDSVGDELTLSAWADGIPKSSISAQDSELTGNVVGIYFAGESQTLATYRSFETLPVPEPAAGASMTVLGLLVAAMCIRRSRKRSQFGGNQSATRQFMHAFRCCAMLVAFFAEPSVAQDSPQRRR